VIDESAFYEQLTEFLRTLNAEDGTEFPAALAPDDNLFDLGLVNSFSTIRMIVFVEELTGAPIDVAEHDLEAFYTMRGLFALVAEQAGARAEH
jgi:hypothetical protein